MEGKTKTRGLDCPICFEAYGCEKCVPMVLSCGHTLCDDCVDKNRRSGNKVSILLGNPGRYPPWGTCVRLRAPLTSSWAPIWWGQVLCPFDSSLWTVTKNFALLQILELEARSSAAPATKSASAQGKTCEICCNDDGESEHHEANVYCMDCEQNMCDKVRRGPRKHRWWFLFDEGEADCECGNRDQWGLCMAPTHSACVGRCLAFQAARIHARTKSSRDHTVVPIEDAEFRCVGVYPNPNRVPLAVGLHED